MKSIHLIYFLFWTCKNNGVDKYLSPESGSSVTILLFTFSFLLATITAALSAAPNDIPTNIPSLLANFLPSSKAASFSMAIISSYIFVLSILGTKPAPIPCILCGPAVPFDKTGLEAGSTAITLIFYF